MSQLLRYLTVGVSNTLLTLVVFAVLTHLGLAPGVASAVAFAAGAGNGYLLNRAWTFRAAARFHRYVAVQALGAACSAGAVALLAALPRLGAEALTLPPVTLLTFALSRTIVFTQPKKATPLTFRGGPRSVRGARRATPIDP